MLTIHITVYFMSYSKSTRYSRIEIYKITFWLIHTYQHIRENSLYAYQYQNVECPYIVCEIYRKLDNWTKSSKKANDFWYFQFGTFDSEQETFFPRNRKTCGLRSTFSSKEFDTYVNISYILYDFVWMFCVSNIIGLNR